MIPSGDCTKSRLNHLSETDKIRDNSRVESGFGKNAGWDAIKYIPVTRCTLRQKTGNRGHSAAFPYALPEWFTRLFTQPGDTCGRVCGGTKPSQNEPGGIDLTFIRDGRRFIMEIKSGLRWGSSSQIEKMTQNFNNARLKLSVRSADIEMAAVDGCCHGQEAYPVQKGGAYLTLCGQDFWRLISNDDQLFTAIIEPLGNHARQRNEAFYEACLALLNRFICQLIEDFCLPNGVIDWEKLVRWVSARPAGAHYPL